VKEIEYIRMGGYWRVNFSSYYKTLLIWETEKLYWRSESLYKFYKFNFMLL